MRIPQSPSIPDLEDVIQAARRLDGRVECTPVRNVPALDEALGCEVWLKCDHMQPTGAFKLRGASNAIARLREQGINKDVATHSSGNHGAALAYAARADGRKAVIVMPENAVKAKIEAVKRFGGEVVFCRPGQAPREAGLALEVQSGKIPVPPYDHPDIITGQGTATLELLSQAPRLDDLITPVGGGGLLAGSALAATQQAVAPLVHGAEPAGAADTAASFEKHQRVTHWEPETIADGLRALIGVLNFQIIKERVSHVHLADDEAIEQAMRLMLDTADLRVEPSAAVAIAVIQCHREIFAGRRVGVILTGGNIDLERYPWLAQPVSHP